MVLKYLLPQSRNPSKMVLVIHYAIIIGIVLLCLLSSAYGIFEVIAQNKNTLSLTEPRGSSNSIHNSALKQSSKANGVSKREISVEGSITNNDVSDFGEECETNAKQCNYSKFLECIDGKCMCQNPFHRAFDEDLQQCVSLAGSGCGGNGQVCVKNSKCTFGSCQCLQGHSETSTKLCLLNRGLSCKPNECNGDQGLACIQATCQCIDSFMVFQPFSNKCVNPQAEFDNFARNLVQRIVLGKITRTVSGAKSLVFLPVRLLVPGIG